MKALRVQYDLCKEVATVNEDFVRDYETLKLEVNMDVWVFWSPCPSDTPQSERQVTRQDICEINEIRSRSRGTAPKGWYKARILLIEGNLK
jgi:hypothetical protein